jgi:hypothetical protein
LLVADLAVLESVASVGQVTLLVSWVAIAVSLRESFTDGTLWWVWVALSVVRWAVVGVDAYVGQVTQVVSAIVALVAAVKLLELGGWLSVIGVGA